MKKLLLILVCLPMIGFGQNLVANGDFEEYSVLPTGGGQVNNCLYWNDLNFVPGVFFPVWPFGSPDYFHADADINTGVSFPTNDFAYVNPYSGDAAIGFSNFLTTQGNPIFPTNSFFFADNYREYISSKLNTKLEIGEIYELSFYLTNGENPTHGSSSNNIGVYFSTDSLTQDTSEVIYVIPQIEIANEVWETSWVNFSFSFIADEEFQFITIGNFNHNNQTSSTYIDTTASLDWSYFFIDKIELYKSENYSVSYENMQKKKLKKIINLFGQEIPIKKNYPMFYVYDEGTVEKKYLIK